ncbi:uncharacterized protein [Miscanthus floridulus]|uniref:uncharacterized protein isoform X3 n=1 Tax=Miscanthus floridulus TaxID=154761 RepID=UPI00345B0A10
MEGYSPRFGESVQLIGVPQHSRKGDPENSEVSVPVERQFGQGPVCRLRSSPRRLFNHRKTHNKQESSDDSSSESSSDDPKTPAKSQSQATGSKTIFDGNLAYSTDREQVKEFFESCRTGSPGRGFEATSP